MSTAKLMWRQQGWNYETSTCLYQLWKPKSYSNESPLWAAAWTERREMPNDYYLSDEDDGWRPDGDFARGKTADEALTCFPTTTEANAARLALLQVARKNRQ